MEISKSHKEHMRKIARMGGLALKKKVPKDYYSKISKKGWKSRKKAVV